MKLALPLLCSLSACVYYSQPLCDDTNRLPMDLSGEYRTPRSADSVTVRKVKDSNNYELVAKGRVGDGTIFDVCLVGEEGQLLVEVQAEGRKADEKAYWALLASVNEKDLELHLAEVKLVKAKEFADKGLLVIDRKQRKIFKQIEATHYFLENSKIKAEDFLAILHGASVSIKFSLPK